LAPPATFFAVARKKEIFALFAGVEEVK